MIYRQGRNYENLNKMIYRGTGKFDTPRLVPRWLQGNVEALAALANSVLRLYSG